MYDSDGFYILIPTRESTVGIKNNRQKRKILSHVKTVSAIGAYRLESANKVLACKQYGQKSFKLHHGGNSRNINYTVNFAPKAWQYKAWRSVCSSIDWTSQSTFKKAKNEKIQHIKALAVSMKLYSDGGKAGKYIHNKLSFGKSKRDTYDTNYVVVTTYNDFKTLMETMFKMVNLDIEKYIEESMRLNYTTLTCIMKAIVVYDDLTFDAEIGNPHNLFRLLGVEFNECTGGMIT